MAEERKQQPRPEAGRGGMHFRGGRGLAPTEKPKDFKGTFRRLLKDFKPLYSKLIIVMIIILISTFNKLVSPLFIRDVLNDIIYRPEQFYIFNNDLVEVLWNELFMRFGFIALFYATASIFNYLSELFLIPITATYSFNLRKQFQAKIDRLPLSFFDGQTYGEILSKGTNDIDAISRSLQSILTGVLSSAFLFVGSLSLMFYVSWELTLVALGVLPISLLITILIGKNSQARFKSYYAKLGNLNSVIEETYSGYKVIKLFNKEQELVNKFEGINADLANADRMSQFYSGIIFPAINFVNNLGFVGIAVVGGLINNVGNMVIFFVLVSLFQSPFQQLSQISNIIQSSIAAAERVYKIMDEKELTPDKVDAITTNKNIKGKVSFKNVSFAYKPEQPLFENLNLEVNPGDAIAIVGPTGAGKTTIVNLIMRFYEISQGQILIDGVNIQDYAYQALRTAIGMVLQDTWLFKGTIKENIRYGKLNATDADVEQAAKASSAHFFITTLPGGYDFELNEEGSNISQGQRQLITIARALLSQPKILILDEATSSVDTRTEAAIQEAMVLLMKGRTSFVIAHRLSTIKSAKLILVMRQGKIVESGNHLDLLKLNGFYAELYNAQFTGTNPVGKTED
jgi:ATP-binding cassette, subfamily B, multidrug efflux pump